MSKELIDRLEKAEAGSGQLDDLVLKATGHVWHLDFGSSWYSMDGGTTRLYSHSAKVTTSLDAALALAERVLPGCRCMVERFHDGSGWAMVQVTPEGPKTMTDGAAPALALVTAILKAQGAQQ